jgi:iron complex outermembrane receptor protein
MPGVLTSCSHEAPSIPALNASQQWRGWHFKEFLRLNNLFDRVYVGSVIVGDTNKRYYEAAPERNWMMGASTRYEF